MPKASSLPVKWQILLLSLISLLIVVADQLSKMWVRSNLEVGQSLPEAGWLRLTHVTNTGSAFGLFQGQSFILTLVALAGIVILLVYALVNYRQLPFKGNTLGKVTVALILGGVIGNLIDRIRLGYVTDFIDVGIWPAFNVADSSMVVGYILFAYLLLSFTLRRKPRSTGDGGEPY